MTRDKDDLLKAFTEVLPAVLAGVRRQVEWNGWEEPYVTQRALEEARKAFAAQHQR